MLDLILTIILAPILLVQGKYVRYKTPKLPEPKGVREDFSDQRQQSLRLLIIGDSSAAGVGVSEQQNALCGQLISNLKPDFTVEWRLVAKTGATTIDALHWLKQYQATPFNIVISVFGVNDVTRLHSLARWKKLQHQLLAAIETTYPQALHIACGLPPIHKFPALPVPLRWFLGRRATAFDGALKRVLSARSQSHYFNLRFDTDPTFMASDGFHPGELMYKEWAIQLSDKLKQLLVDSGRQID